MEKDMAATHKKEPSKKKLTVSTDSSFESILKASTFVDKTLLIKKVFQTQSEENDETDDIVENEHPKIMITAPRRFGKSVNLDMICSFLELEVDKKTGKQITTAHLKSETVCDTPNYKLFTVNKNSEAMHLQIMADAVFVKTHFGKYPIIKVSFLCCETVNSETDALNICKESIHQAFKKHPYLYESSESQLKVDERKVCEQWSTEEEKHRDQFTPAKVIKGLKDLSEYLNKFHGRKVFVLIDEFDSIVSKAIDTVTDKDELKKIIGVVKGVIGRVVKDNSANLAGVLITGILDLHGTGISSLLGNVAVDTFGEDKPRLKYYGFNLEEVEKLFEIFSVDEGLRKKAIIKYNCYYTKRGEDGIFNPYAIVRFLENHRRGDASLENYWQESGYVHQSLSNFFKNDKVKELIRQMLKGRWFPVNFPSHLNLENLTELHIANRDPQAYISTDLLSLFLLRQGYLSYIRRESLPTAVGIPEDLRPVIVEKMVQYLMQHCGINEIVHNDCQRHLDNVMHLVNIDKTDFIKALKLFTNKLVELIETTSLDDPCKDAVIETIVSSVVLAAGYTYVNQVYNIEQNRLNVIAHKNGQGIIIELRYEMERSSRGALTHLFNQGYYKNFINQKDSDGSDIKLHLALGLHFTTENRIRRSKVKASVHCLRDVEINEVLREMRIEKVDRSGIEIVIEDRIAMACDKKDGINSFVEKAICVTN